MSELAATPANPVEGDRPKTTRIRVQIPKKYQNEPLISRLATQYHLDVNIAAATLGLDNYASGWFDLQLSGLARNIGDAIHYLLDQDVEILQWDKNEVDGW